MSAADIQAVDRVAALIKDFNPLAFTSLVQQLEALAQNNAANALAANPNTVNPAGASALAKATATGGGFQLQELVIRFSGVDVQGTLGGTQGSGRNSAQNPRGAFELSAFSLQVQEVTLTLASPSGQNVQVTAPQAAQAKSAGA